jgi:hypothetical protein
MPDLPGNRDGELFEFFFDAAQSRRYMISGALQATSTQGEFT